MEIIKGAITRLASEGRITLQIPQISIGAPGMKVETEEIPDNWVVILRTEKYPAVGKQQGFLFLTKIGWNANKDKIKEAYENAKFNRGPWTKFEVHVIEHFMRVEAQTERKIKLLEKNLEKLKKTKLTWF